MGTNVRLSSGLGLVAGALALATAAGEPVQVMYSSCKDFSQGVSANVICEEGGPDESGLLTLSDVTTTTEPIMWIANAGEGSVSKWDTRNNREVARYRTDNGPFAITGAFGGPAPSRTAVDLLGNAFVANRRFDGRRPQLLKLLNNDFIDRNGSGLPDTSTDFDNNGVIDPAAEMIYHLADDGDDILETFELADEKIAWITEYGDPGSLGRAVAVDPDNNAWVGTNSNGQWFKIDGETGDLLAGPFLTGHNPYGAFVDRDRILWSIDLSGGRLMKFDVNPGSEGQLAIFNTGVSSYGIAGGRDLIDGRTLCLLGNAGGGWRIFDTVAEAVENPAGANAIRCYAASFDGDGNIIAGDFGSDIARKYAQDGTVLWANTEAALNPADRATIVDTDGDAWRIWLSGNSMQKLDGDTGAIVGVFPTGREPYTYSDATGIGLRTSFPRGTWTATYDSGCVDTRWTSVQWNEFVPADTEVVVRARTSNDLVTFSDWETVASGNAIDAVPGGRYIQAEFQLANNGSQEQPEVYDVTINGVKPMFSIDIYPGRDVNPVFLDRDSTLYVVVFSSETFNAATMNWQDVRFGDTGTETQPVRPQLVRDFNDDGMLDAMFGFRTSKCGFEAGDTSGTLTALSPGGCPVSSADSVVVSAGRPTLGGGN